MTENIEKRVEESKPYWHKIRELEAQLFPEFKEEDYSFTSPETNYAYYAPNVHFRKGLVTEANVENFLEDPDKKMLSVGAGPAYLERLLVHLGINKDRITLADIEPHDLPDGFARKIFDMSKEWPEFNEDEKFDLIVFPESPPINDFNKSDEQIVKDFSLLIERALHHLQPDGEIKMTGNPNHPMVVEKVEQELRKMGHDVTVQNSDNQWRESAIVVKNETAPNSDYSK